MTLTLLESAQVCGVTTTTVRRWVMAGDLEPVRRGAKPLRFRESDVLDLDARRIDSTERARMERARHACGISA